MTNQLLHTPDGVRDIYSQECARKSAVESMIRDKFHLFGYSQIQTPTFEFFDIFNKDRGSVASTDMYKFFDRNNNTLVLRPDITPSIARCVAKYYMTEDMPIRLFYVGSTFINNTSYQGRLKESTQTGVELIGDDTADADAEMIALVIESLKETGLKEFQVELGQVEFYRGLVEEAGFDSETREQLRELIENKNFFGVEELLSEESIEADLKELFLKLPELFGSIEQIRLAKTMTNNARALKAIERLEEIHGLLTLYGMSEYVSYDLGMLSKYSYYTGIIFKGYTYGMGDYIVTGGRYDKLLVQFGKDTAAIGFGIEVDRLLLALSRQDIMIETSKVDVIVLYTPAMRKEAILQASQYRKEEKSVQLIVKSTKKELEEYMDYAKRCSIDQVIVLNEKDNG